MGNRKPASPARRRRGAGPIALALATVVLGGCSVFGIRTAAEPQYRVVETDGAIELRDYAGYVTIETLVDGDFETAANRAFRKLFRYISGENRAGQTIDMTAPVVAGAGRAVAGEKIDMTAPVIAGETPAGWRYAFVLPSTFTIDNAPLPLDPDLELVAVAPRRVAVLKSSGRGREARLPAQAARLRDWIADRNLVPVAAPQFASYDPPWTLPPLRRNEVFIAVADR